MGVERKYWRREVKSKERKMERGDEKGYQRVKGEGYGK